MTKIIDTVLSLSFDIRIPELDKAKMFMGEKYGSVYNEPGHLTILICPVSEANYQSIHNELVEYINRLAKVKIRFTDLFFNPDRNFFGLNIQSESLTNLETDLLRIGNKYREGAIRQKDLDRINNGIFTSPQLIQNIYDNGFIYSGKYFHPHISVGNVTKGDFEIEIVKSEIMKYVGKMLNNYYTFDVIRLMYQLDAVKKEDMKDLVDEVYNLK